MDQNAFRQFQLKYQAEAKSINDLEEKIFKLRAPSSKLLAQVQENEMVKSELDNLTDENAVFKLIGPVLVKQELSDVKLNVDRRLKYLHGELERIENEAKTLTEQQDKHKKTITEMQAYMRKLQREAAERAASQAGPE